MAYYNLNLPDGRTVRVVSHDNATKADLAAAANEQHGAGLGHDPVTDTIYVPPVFKPAAPQGSAVGSGLADAGYTLAGIAPGMAAFGLEGLRRITGGAGDGALAGARDWAHDGYVDLMANTSFDPSRHGVEALKQGNVLGPLGYWGAYALPQAAAFLATGGVGSVAGRALASRAGASIAAQRTAAAAGSLGARWGLGVGLETGHSFPERCSTRGETPAPWTS